MFNFRRTETNVFMKPCSTNVFVCTQQYYALNSIVVTWDHVTHMRPCRHGLTTLSLRVSKIRPVNNKRYDI